MKCPRFIRERYDLPEDATFWEGFDEVSQPVWRFFDLFVPKIVIERPFWDEPAKPTTEAPKVDRSADPNTVTIGGQTFVKTDPDRPEAESQWDKMNKGNLKGRSPILTDFDYNEIDASMLEGAPYKLDLEKYRVLKPRWATGDGSKKITSDLKKELGENNGFGLTLVKAHVSAMNRALKNERTKVKTSVDSL